MVSLTEKAIVKVKEFATAEGIKPSIRLVMRGGGCSGSTFDMYFDELITELDETIKVSDIDIIIDPFTFEFLDKFTVDFIETEFQYGFKFIGPDNIKSCGCGSSFSL